MMAEKRNTAKRNSNDSEPGESSDESVTENAGESSKEKKKHQQDLLDEGIEESFPASDTPTVSRVD